MEVSSYVVIDASIQGRIEGSCLRKGRENRIAIYDFSHSVHLPYQGNQRSATGKVVHEPVVFTKEVDKSTPRLYQALARRECLNTVTFTWYRFTPVGTEELYYQMELSNAYFLEVAPWTPEPAKPNTNALRFMETVKLAYENVKWSYGSDGEITNELCIKGQ